MNERQTAGNQQGQSGQETFPDVRLYGTAEPPCPLGSGGPGGWTVDSLSTKEGAFHV